jgi:hypothetical protein
MNQEAASVIARRIASIPARTSTETWQAIVGLLAPSGSAAHRDLTSITSIAAVLISEEYTREAPIVVMPASGPRIRIHTIYGMDAIEAIHEETPLYGSELTESGWQMSLPCGADDLDEMTAALAGTPAITVRDMCEGLAAQPTTAADAAAMSLPAARAGIPVIDLKELRRV